MTITREINLYEFTPWSGAIDTWTAIKDHNKIDELETVLEDIHPEGMTETELNDLLWFEPEMVCGWVELYYNDGIISDKEIDEY